MVPKSLRRGCKGKKRRVVSSRCAARNLPVCLRPCSVLHENCRAAIRWFGLRVAESSGAGTCTLGCSKNLWEDFDGEGGTWGGWFPTDPPRRLWRFSLAPATSTRPWGIPLYPEFLRVKISPRNWDKIEKAPVVLGALSVAELVCLKRLQSVIAIFPVL
jgi:hypothetical protein